MSFPIPVPRVTAPSDDDEGVILSSPEALLAGTLALMTGVVERAALVQPLTTHGQSLLMASKVGVNLHRLAAHPHLSPAFRSTLERLRTHWDRLVVPAGDHAVSAGLSEDEVRQRLWHRAPERVQ